MTKFSKLALFSILMLISSQLFSQAYLDTMAKELCEYISNLPDTLSTNDYNMKLGFFMLEKAGPYKKQLKKDFSLDLDILDPATGEKLGKIVGTRMATICPEKLVNVYNRVKSKSIPKTNTESSIAGTVLKIESDNFVIFSIKDDNGKVTKYHWMTLIKADDDFISKYWKLMNKQVSLTYRTEEFFDPKINEYRIFNIITSIETDK